MCKDLTPRAAKRMLLSFPHLIVTLAEPREIRSQNLSMRGTFSPSKPTSRIPELRLVTYRFMRYGTGT